MKNVLKLELNIQFTEKIVSDDDIKEIVNNVLQGMMRQIDEVGISPEKSDVYVSFIEVNEPLSGVCTDIHYV